MPNTVLVDIVRGGRDAKVRTCCRCGNHDSQYVYKASMMAGQARGSRLNAYVSLAVSELEVEVVRVITQTTAT